MTTWNSDKALKSRPPLEISWYERSGSGIFKPETKRPIKLLILDVSLVQRIRGNMGQRGWCLSPGHKTLVLWDGLLDNCLLISQEVYCTDFTTCLLTLLDFHWFHKGFFEFTRLWFSSQELCWLANASRSLTRCLLTSQKVSWFQ